MSSVPSRILRYYDRVGLLKPAYLGSNGFRYYQREQLLRLQRLLLLRELGLGSGALAEVLDGQRDQVDALRRHERWLHGERDRLGRLAATVARTLQQLQGGPPLTPPELFEGFTNRYAHLETDRVQQHPEGVREHLHSRTRVTSNRTASTAPLLNPPAVAGLSGHGRGDRPWSRGFVG